MVSVRKRGYEFERIVLNTFLRHRICRKRLSDIRPEDFAAYRDERLRNIKTSTLKRQLAPLHNMFELAKDEWGVPLRENPPRKVRIAPGQSRRERRLRQGEMDALSAGARVCRNRLILPIVLLAVETGMRRSEILSLRWQHIDRKASALLIPHGKNGHSPAAKLGAEVNDQFFSAAQPLAC
jgi:integrase